MNRQAIDWGKIFANHIPDPQRGAPQSLAFLLHFLVQFTLHSPAKQFISSVLSSNFQLFLTLFQNNNFMVAFIYFSL